MTRPTKSTEWATDPSALKIDPDAGQISYGWSTSDNTINGIPVKPNLQQQNGWQNAVHQWIDYFDDTIGYDQQEILDLWKWDAGDTSGNQTGNYLTGYIEDAFNSGVLKIYYQDTSYSDVWASNKANMLTGSRYREILDMFSRGIGLQIVDAADVIWTIYPTGNWGNFLSSNNGLNWVNVDANIQGTVGGEVNVTLDPLAGGSAMFNIIKNDGGTITNPSDFAGFVGLSNANFATQNPNGVRAVLVGNKNIDNSYTWGGGKIIALKDLPKRWISTLTSGTGNVPSLLTTHIPITLGKSYRCWMNAPIGTDLSTSTDFQQRYFEVSTNTSGGGNSTVWSGMVNRHNFGGNPIYYMNHQFEFTAVNSSDFLTLDQINFDWNNVFDGTVSQSSPLATRMQVEEI